MSIAIVIKDQDLTRFANASLEPIPRKGKTVDVLTLEEKSPGVWNVVDSRPMPLPDPPNFFGAFGRDAEYSEHAREDLPR